MELLKNQIVTLKQVPVNITIKRDGDFTFVLTDMEKILESSQGNGIFTKTVNLDEMELGIYRLYIIGDFIKGPIEIIIDDGVESHNVPIPNTQDTLMLVGVVTNLQDRDSFTARIETSPGSTEENIKNLY